MEPTMSTTAAQQKPLFQPLTPAEIASFHAEGFLLRRAVFDAAEIQVMATAFDTMCEQASREMARLGKIDRSTTIDMGSARLTIQPDAGAPQGASIRHIAWCSGMSEALRRVGRDSRLTKAAAQLLRSESMHHIINQAHFKLPGSVVAFDWHQDSTHRGVERGEFVDLNGTGSYVQTAIAIDPITSENGPLALIPRSNHRGHLPHQQGKLSPQDVDAVAAVRPELDPGDVLFFGPYTIHGSQPNRSLIARRSFLNGFAYPGATQREYSSSADGEGQIISA
jgi:hypothetical protein